jgi:type II secretory pathway component PulF
MSQLYRCRAVDASGKTRNIERRAASERMLSHALQLENLSLVEATPIVGHEERKLSISQVLEFTQGLELLFGRNLSLKDAVHVLATINGQAKLQNLIGRIEERLDKGDSLAQALEDYRSSFPPLYLGLIRVGELTGTLKRVLPQLTRYLEDKKKLRDKILASLMYPSLILAILFIGMILLNVFVLPKFLLIAEALQGPGSGTGHIRDGLIGFKTVFISCVLAIPLIAFLCSFSRKRPKARLAIDRMLFTKIPFNKLFATIEMQNLCFALGALLESGYTIDIALDECKRVTNNRALALALEDVRLKTKKGARLSASFRESGILPRTFCSWVEVGEEAHDLKEVFRHLRDYYEQAFEKTTRAIMGLVEPGLIIMVGGIIVVVILQFIGPIFTLMGGAM